MPYADALFRHPRRGPLRRRPRRHQAADPPRLRRHQHDLRRPRRRGHHHVHGRRRSPECVRRRHIGLRRLRVPEAVHPQSRQAGRRGRAIRHPGHGGHRRGPRAGPARLPLPRHGLPHLRRDGRQGGQDLLVRGRLRPRGRRLPGSRRHGRRPQGRHRARGPGVRPRRHAERRHRHQPRPQHLAEPPPRPHDPRPPPHRPRQRHRRRSPGYLRRRPCRVRRTRRRPRLDSFPLATISKPTVNLPSFPRVFRHSCGSGNPNPRFLVYSAYGPRRMPFEIVR
ncbi:hypothetical protein GBAR_LOCUS3300 [Geodia barretti]|uniref:Uncharacterized protein n=1 Tax=Geodia barretti TaxID=519541 RepID=A0AA35W8D0_GEOBA|nr:hypothetical protein GBAR_LOCUS3300 [Geodia barretti]